MLVDEVIEGPLAIEGHLGEEPAFQTRQLAVSQMQGLFLLGLFVDGGFVLLDVEPANGLYEIMF